MGDFGDYIKALFSKTREMVTGGLIALYLAIQPYTPLPSTPRKLFWAALGAAWATASFRVWRDERRLKNQATAELVGLQASERDAEVNWEDPRVALYVRWPHDNPTHGPPRLFARNRGRFRLRSFQLKTLTISLYSVSFDEVAELAPDIEQPITYHTPAVGGELNTDILDLLMVNKPSEIGPMIYQLRAEVQKENGQRRDLVYSLTYAPLHNPRRVPGASEFNLLIVVDQVS